MKVKEHFNVMMDYFHREHMDFALAGAYALHAYGYTRATRDVDFLTRQENQSPVVAFLESKGFNTIHRSDGFSNHYHPVSHIRIYFIYVDSDTAEKIFSAMRSMTLLGEIDIPVVSPEHLIAMKLFAAKNDPSRKWRELSDIRELILHTHVDLDDVRHYFILYELETYFDELPGTENQG